MQRPWDRPIFQSSISDTMNIQGLPSKLYVLSWKLVFLMVCMDIYFSRMHTSKSYSSEETVGKEMKPMFPGRKIISNIWQNEIG